MLVCVCVCLCHASVLQLHDFIRILCNKAVLTHATPPGAKYMYHTEYAYSIIPCNVLVSNRMNDDDKPGCLAIIYLKENEYGGESFARGLWPTCFSKLCYEFVMPKVCSYQSFLMPSMLSVIHARVFWCLHVLSVCSYQSFLMPTCTVSVFMPEFLMPELSVCSCQRFLMPTCTVSVFIYHRNSEAYMMMFCQCVHNQSCLMPIQGCHKFGFCPNIRIFECENCLIWICKWYANEAY